MTIARRWIKEGHSITWPVLPQFVEGLQRAYPDVTFIDWQSINIDYERKDEHDVFIRTDEVTPNHYRVVPLRWNVEIMNVPYERCMESKYSMFNIDYREWRELAKWERGEKKERELFALKNPHSEYNLVNRFYQSDSKGIIDIKTNNGLPDVCFENVEGYSLFDWALVLENATEIHTVSTSIIYLLELLDITCDIHLYPRPSDPKFEQVEYLFTKPYILH